MVHIVVYKGITVAPYILPLEGLRLENMNMVTSAKGSYNHSDDLIRITSKHKDVIFGTC